MSKIKEIKERIEVQKKLIEELKAGLEASLPDSEQAQKEVDALKEKRWGLMKDSFRPGVNAQKLKRELLDIEAQIKVKEDDLQWKRAKEESIKTQLEEAEKGKENLQTELRDTKAGTYTSEFKKMADRYDQLTLEKLELAKRMFVLIRGIDRIDRTRQIPQMRNFLNDIIATSTLSEDKVGYAGVPLGRAEGGQLAYKYIVTDEFIEKYLKSVEEK